jgi:large subunit ribosomal protein L17
MRHHNTKRKFGRVKKQRDTLIASLALNLIVRGRIKTTLAKAKELRPFIEKLVTYAKVKNLARRRLIISRLANRKREAEKLFTIAEKYVDRPGGYTRILKLGQRIPDGAKMAIIEFV